MPFFFLVAASTDFRAADLMPSRVQISDTLARSLVETIQLRHHLISGRGPDPRWAPNGYICAVDVWASYFSAYSALIELSLAGDRQEDHERYLITRVNALRRLGIALEAQGDTTASTRRRWPTEISSAPTSAAADLQAPAPSSGGRYTLGYLPSFSLFAPLTPIHQTFPLPTSFSMSSTSAAAALPEGPELQTVISCLQTISRKTRFVQATLSQMIGRSVFEPRFVAGTPATPEQVAASFVDQHQSQAYWVVLSGRELGLYTISDAAKEQTDRVPHQQQQRVIGFQAALAFYTAHYPEDVQKWVEVEEDNLVVVN
ncbi:hypothetical protein B0H19DRAFT_1245806 [Mycena capillaripes]|nr:hypothetical protein B0H19DRAFT_1245806 [Mycena capillaripes]